MMTWIEGHTIQLLITAGVIVSYWLLDRFGAARLERQAESGRFGDESAVKAIRVARLIAALAAALMLAIVWGIRIGSVVVFAGTTLTLLGVALFANWSLLSNVTAYFALLLHPSFRRGTFIRVFEGDNYVEGYIAEIHLMSTRLITENREVILYPNNLLIGRPAIVNPRDRLGGIGKLSGKPSATARPWKRTKRS